MTRQQLIALEHHCRLASEQAHPRFISPGPDLTYSINLTIDSGYECLQMGWGGPVWCVSAAGVAHGSYLSARAFEALVGVGSIRLGQWEEWTGRTFLVRRRLTPSEVQLAGIREAIDVRGTEEGQRRLAIVRTWAPDIVLRIADREASKPA